MLRFSRACFSPSCRCGHLAMQRAGPGARNTCFPKSASDISCRSATAPGCCSTPSIRWRTVRMAIAWTTMPGRCFSRRRLPGTARRGWPTTLTARFAAFIQHAWNPDTGRFRNFMSYDRRWLEPSGSEDSHGRTLWALADHAAAETDPARRRWAAALFRTALPAVRNFTSPRAWAFSLLGLDAYCAQNGGDAFAEDVRRELADRLLSLLSSDGERGLALVRGPARLRQCAPAAGADPDRPGDKYPGLCRGGSSIAALADVPADDGVRLLPAGRHRKFWPAPRSAQGVRSTARRGLGGDFRLSRGRPGRRQRRMVDGSAARLRLVPRRK